MSKIVLAYAILSLLPIGFLIAMIRSIGFKGAAYVLQLLGGAFVAAYAFAWAINVVVNS